MLLIAASLLSVVSAQNLSSRVEAVIERAPGTVSLFAKNLETGRTFGVRPDERVRTASTIKLPIMAALFGTPADAPYAARVQALERAGVALWDVLATCERSGSLDAAIRRDSEVVNDIAGLLARCPAIRVVAFNGAAAEAAFRRHCLDLRANSALRFIRLPSTSPAHAALSREAKCSAWRAALIGR